MKKNYILSLILTFFFAVLSFGQSPIITAIVDGDCSGGNPKLLEIYAKGTVDFTLYSLENQTNSNSTWANTQDLSSFGTVTDGFVYVSTSGSSAGLASDFPSVTSVLETNTMSVNGDDRVRIVLTSDSSVIDQYGVESTDGDGSAWEYKDSYAKRVDGSGPDAGFVEANWTFGGVSALNTLGVCQGGTSTFEDIIGGIATYSSVASTVPELSITSPTNNQVFPGSTSEVSINFNYSNFTLSGDNGSEMTDNAGDGYILGSLFMDGVSEGTKNIFSNSVLIENPTPGSTYVVTAELVDNSGASLSPKVESTVTFSVELPCDLILGNIATTCDALTGGTDAYSGTIDFTGGNTGTNYTISAPSGVTIGGDNPDSVADGTITFSGMTEGADAAITIVGGTGSSCDLSRTLSSPTCISFPVIEHFDYTDGVNLGDQNSWSMLNSGDQMTVTSGNLEYTGLETSTGNKITFEESGSETYTAFPDVTSGNVYASFLLKVTAFQTGTNIDLTDGGYIAALAGSTSGYDARFWVRPNPDTSGSTFDIGFGSESSNPTFSSGTYALNDVLFVVMAYNMDDATVSTWVNPDASSFGGTIPTATITSTDTNAPAAINLFVLRQDSNNETPFIELDALRISNSWADVTPKDATASLNNNSIDGFAAYPNPVTNNKLTITSNSSDKKQVTIFNVLGKKVLTSSFLGTKSNVDVSTISSGLYILKVTEGSRISTSKLVIK
jgi:hypothetical protein